MQSAHLDPVLYESVDNPRVGSTLGNPIFLGAYLIMVVPLTLWRIGQLWQELRRQVSSPADEKSPDDAAMTSCSDRVLLCRTGLILYGGTTVAQLTALILSQSRGPLVGLLAGLAFGSVLLAAYTGRWRLLRVPLAILAIAGTFLVLLNIPNGPLEGLRDQPVLRRFATVLSAGNASAFRAGVWPQAPEVVLSDSPLAFPNDGTDSYHALRPLLGYGPETLGGVVAQHYSLPRTPPERVNRFHTPGPKSLNLFRPYRATQWLPSCRCMPQSLHVLSGGIKQP